MEVSLKSLKVVVRYAMNIDVLERRVSFKFVNSINMLKLCIQEEHCGHKITDTNVYSLGCLDMTIMGTNAIFGVAVICMLVAFALAVRDAIAINEILQYLDLRSNQLENLNSSLGSRLSIYERS